MDEHFITFHKNILTKKLYLNNLIWDREKLTITHGTFPTEIALLQEYKILPTP